MSVSTLSYSGVSVIMAGEFRQHFKHPKFLFFLIIHVYIDIFIFVKPSYAHLRIPSAALHMVVMY